MTECQHTFTNDKERDMAVGCWYCSGEDSGPDSQALVFSFEWDTFVHLCCIAKAIADDPSDVEAKVFYREASEGKGFLN